MAQHKYLTYDGLKTLVSKVASVITGTVGESGITLYLHGKTKDSSGKVINTAQISNVVIPIAGATQANGTEAASGLITAAELKRLGGIATGAEVNQHAFSNVNITNNNGGSALKIEADSKTDTLNLTAGSNIKITGNADNDTITIANTYSYTHPSPGAKDSKNLNDQLPDFGGTVNYIKQVTSNNAGHVTAINTGTITIPALPNVTVTAGANTAAANAGDTIVQVVKALANSTTSSDTKIYVDYTTVEVPTKKYVDGLITTSEAVVLKGTTAELIASTGNLSKGDTYICAAAISGNAKFGTLEKGDVVIYNNATDNTYEKSASSDWIVIQANANVYNGSYGFVPNKKNTTASASYFLNEKGEWSIPGKRGVKVNNTNVFNTTTDGTINLKSSNNITITTGTADSNGTPITFDVNKEKVSLVGHTHTITANEEGDNWITVVGTNGTNAVTYKVTHNDPDDTATNVYSAADGSALTMGTSNVVTGVKYDDKGHIIGVTSGKLPSDSKGVTKITPGTGLRNGTGTSAITSSGTLNLIAATDSELGGMKITSKDTSAIAINDKNRFGVKLTSANFGYVEIPEITTAEINGLFA
jgi:hypothetical protein